MIQEFTKSFKWTTALALPFFLVGACSFNVHGGPGGYWVFIGIALFLPLVVLHDFVFPAISVAFSGLLGIAIILLSQLIYWFLIVHSARLLIQWFRHDKKIAAPFKPDGGEERR